MKYLALLAALATIWGAGCGTLMLLWRDPRKILLAELLAYPWLLGTGVVTLALAVIGMLFPAPACFPVVATGSLLLGIVGILRLRRGGRIASGLVGAGAWEKWGCLLVLAPIACMAAVTFRDSLMWDGLVNWEAKARHAFLAGGALPASYYTDATRTAFHLNYPLCLPGAELWAYLWMGQPDQTTVKALFPVFFSVLPLLLWSTTLRMCGRPAAATATAILPLFVPLMMDHGMGLLHGYADLLLGIAYLAAVGALILWSREKCDGHWRLAAACGALLPWIKQEGLILFGCLLVQAVLTRGGRAWRPLLALALPGIAVALGWRAALHLLHVRQESDFLPGTWENLSAGLPRLKTILDSVAAELTHVRDWGLLWFATALALPCLLGLRRREAPILAAAILLPLALDTLPFLLTRLDLPSHIAAALNRLLLQIAPVAVLSLGLAAVAREKDPAVEKQED